MKIRFHSKKQETITNTVYADDLALLVSKILNLL